MSHFATALLQWLYFNQLHSFTVFNGYRFPASVMFIRKATIIPNTNTGKYMGVGKNF